MKVSATPKPVVPTYDTVEIPKGTPALTVFQRGLSSAAVIVSGAAMAVIVVVVAVTVVALALKAR